MKCSLFFANRVKRLFNMAVFVKTTYFIVNKNLISQRNIVINNKKLWLLCL